MSKVMVAQADSDRKTSSWLRLSGGAKGPLIGLLVLGVIFSLTTDVFLSVRNSAPNGSFHDISSSVHAGEVLGLAGIIGAGRTGLVRAIAGVNPIASGGVWIDGEPVRFSCPSDAIRGGVALVPEDRKAQGLILAHTLADNIALSNLDRLAPRGWLWPRRVLEFAEQTITQLGVKGRPTQAARMLSGGNQQKLVIAKWITRSPKVIILDEPTRGIDVGARAAIYEVIANLARAGAAIVVVSSDLEEVLGLSHRVLVLSRGGQSGVLSPSEASNVRVMELATM